MFDMFKRPKQVVVREGVTQQVTDLLFPQPTETSDESGTYLIDRSVDLNLQGALIDLESGMNDEVVRNTIRKVISRLGEARELLYANYKIQEGASYLQVDPPRDTLDDISDAR